jgi:hypothetical protein
MPGMVLLTRFGLSVSPPVPPLSGPPLAAAHCPGRATSARRAFLSPLTLFTGAALVLAGMAYRRAEQALVMARRASREQMVFALRDAAHQDALHPEDARLEQESGKERRAE